MKLRTILVTGAAGFIGHHLCNRLLTEGNLVVGVDSINDYYDTTLKKARLSITQVHPNFIFYKARLEDKEQIRKVFRDYKFDIVINLAAQAGVRYSLVNPQAYIDSNVTGFLNILEAAKDSGIRHLIYASSSSVYGANQSIPFSVHDTINHPVSLYAATKKTNELMAHTYSHLYGVPTTGLRFFTVYGPMGRPDMAYFTFTKAILEGKPIQVFNHGKMKRDFTYIDDIVDGVVKVTYNHPPGRDDDYDRVKLDPAGSYAPYKVYNLGNNKPVELLKFINVLETELGIEAKKEFLPMQLGDVEITYADIDDSINDFNYAPTTSIETGLKQFVKWYKEFYGI